MAPPPGSWTVDLRAPAAWIVAFLVGWAILLVLALIPFLT
jgi:hypothetical protein